MAKENKLFLSIIVDLQLTLKEIGSWCFCVVWRVTFIMDIWTQMA